MGVVIQSAARQVSPSATHWRWILVAITLTGAVFFVFRGALAMFFAQEDFRGIAAARGILPRHSTPWRYVSVQAFMDVCYPCFGDRARPYHLVSNALHAANSHSLTLWMTTGKETRTCRSRLPQKSQTDALRVAALVKPVLNLLARAFSKA